MALFFRHFQRLGAVVEWWNVRTGTPLTGGRLSSILFEPDPQPVLHSPKQQCSMAWITALRYQCPRSKF